MTSESASTTQRIRVGCAGWSIGSPYRALFGEGDSVLSRYATVFDAVEINSSFYGPHQQRTYQRWAQSVPDDFRFSLKIPRAISHEARLHEAGPVLDAFLEQASGLGHKLSVLLLQLPPSLRFDADAVSRFLSLLRSRWQGEVVCEPRHGSWFAADARALLHRHRIAMVGADPAPHPLAAEPAGPLRYWRWHGSPRMYYSEYGAAQLARLGSLMASASAEAPVWCIFDNTAAGFALPNALELRRLLGGS